MQNAWRSINKAWRVGSIGGISVEISPTWLAFCVVWTVACALVTLPTLYPHWHPGTYWGLALVSAVLVQDSLLLHELAHALMAKKRCMPVTRITMHAAYAAAHRQSVPDQPRSDLLIALAGPGASLALAMAFGSLVVGAQALHLEPLAAVSMLACALNLVWGTFNALPIYPMDGGRALQALLWAATGKRSEATRWAAVTGFAIAGASVVLGIAYLAVGRQTGGLVLTLAGLVLLLIAGIGAEMVGAWSGLRGRSTAE